MKRIFHHLILWQVFPHYFMLWSCYDVEITYKKFNVAFPLFLEVIFCN